MESGPWRSPTQGRWEKTSHLPSLFYTHSNIIRVKGAKGRGRDVSNEAVRDVVPQWVMLGQRAPHSLLIPLLNGKEGRRERGPRKKRLECHGE